MLGFVLNGVIYLGSKAVSSYIVLPVCGYVATQVGTYIGGQAIRSIYNTGVNKLRGVVNLTLKRSKIYIIYGGEPIEIDPRRKYIICRGEIKVIDGAADIIVSDIDSDLFPAENDIPMVSMGGELIIKDDWKG
jgi:hypothetical protein